MAVCESRWPRVMAPRLSIPKADGTNSPLGIPTFEDKVAQRAILMLLEPIYETNFLPCSYGFRPKRSAHDALNVLRAGITMETSVQQGRFCLSRLPSPAWACGTSRKREPDGGVAGSSWRGLAGVWCSIAQCGMHALRPPETP